jgi:hypothetical protein
MVIVKNETVKIRSEFLKNLVLGTLFQGFFGSECLKKLVGNILSGIISV